jgi:hypothetical protein
MTDQGLVKSVGTAPWPMVIVMLGQALLLPDFRAMTAKTQVSLELLLLGAACFLSAVLLRFVDLPRTAARWAKDDPYPTPEIQKVMAGPLALLATLILALGGALYFLQDDPAAANAAFIVFAVMGVAVGAAMVLRVWRVCLAHSRKDS